MPVPVSAPAAPPLLTTTIGGLGTQLSVKVGGVQFTILLHSEGAKFTVMFAGQFVVTGASTSITVTFVNAVVGHCPAPGEVVKVIGVVPTGKMPLAFGPPALALFVIGGATGNKPCTTTLSTSKLQAHSPAS